MKNFKFFKDITSESSGGKYSSKKIWGHVFMTLTGITYILDGLHFYEVDHHLFDAMLISGTTLIGLNAITSMFKGKSKEETPDEKK
jgi:hypothetical protein